MDPIDEALLEAWGRVAPAVRRDRVEALRRSFRRTRPLLTRPIRPWCLCLRASDRRLNVHAWVPKYLPEQHEPHEIVVFSDTIRELCKPVTIPWPGWDWERAAYALGRHPETLRSWISRGVFRVRHVPAAALGKRGKPVPEIWSPSALDPNADEGRPPDPIWGTLWQFLWERVPDDLEFTLTRVPTARRHPRDHPARTRHCGWQFICPGLAGQESGISGQESGTRGQESGVRSQESDLRTQDSSSLPSCGRAVDRLFIPLRPWTMLDALDLDDPLGVTLPFRSGTQALTCSRTEPTGSMGRGVPSPADLPAPPAPHGVPSSFTPACRRCHRIQYFSLVSPGGWSQFVAHLSAGLLHGHEVSRARNVVVRRKRPFQTHRAPQRERVLKLLSRGLTSGEIGARLGIGYGGVVSHIRCLFKLYSVHSRAQLCAQLTLPYSRPMPARLAQVLRGLLDGLSAQELADRLNLARSTITGHCHRLYRIHGVHSRAQLLARLRGRALGAPSLRDGRLCLAKRQQPVARGAAGAPASQALGRPRIPRRAP